MRSFTVRRIVGCLMLVLAVAALGWLRDADARAFSLVGNTLFLCLGVSVIALPVGTLLGWLLARSDLPGGRLVVGSLTLLFFVPLYVQAAAWDAGFGLQGSLTLHFFGGHVWLTGWPAVVWIHALATIPWVALCSALGAWSVERELEEQALLDLPAWKVGLRVSLRRAAPAIGLALLGIVITVATETTITDLFRVRTVAEELFTLQQLGDEQGLRSAALASLAATGWLVGLALAIGASMAAVVRARSSRSPRRLELGNMRWFSAALAGLIVLLAVGAPVACLAYKAGLQVEMIGSERVRHWSAFGAIAVTLRSVGRFQDELGWSCAAAIVTASCAVLVAAPLAWLTRKRGWLGWIVAALGIAMLATPGPLLALGIMRMLSQPDPSGLAAIASHWGFSERSGLLVWLRDQPLNLLVVVQLWRALPWGLGLLWFSLRTVPEAQLDAAKLDGLGAWARFLRVGLAQHRRSVMAAWIVAFTIALGELPASVLVAPPGVVTLPIQVFNQLHYGAEKEVAGVCLAVLLLQGAVVLGTFWWQKRTRDH